MSGLAIFFLAIFGLALFGSYIVIRRGWLDIRTTGGLGTAVSITSLIGFGLAENLQLAHALVIGVVVGIGFSGAVLIMAAFFQANQPENLDAYLRDNHPSSE